MHIYPFTDAFISARWDASVLQYPENGPLEEEEEEEKEEEEEEEPVPA